MPGKARRVASRQAQLVRRRKRQQNKPEDGQPAVTPARPVEQAEQQSSNQRSAVPESPAQDSPVMDSPAPDSPALDSPALDSNVAETPEVPAGRPAARPSRPYRPSPVAARTAEGELIPPRGGARGRRDRIVAQVNIGAEIKRILAMSSTVLAIIIVLGIVL